jgi:diguanylate cyclase (GGDEF)-like protein
MGKCIPTIRSRLVLLVMACTIPTFLMVVALLAYDYNEDSERLTENSTVTARAIMSAVDRDLAGMQAALLALATSPHLATDNLAAFYDQAQDVLKLQKSDNIVLLDAKGQQLINTLRPFGSKLPNTTNPALRQVFETGAPVIADLFHGPVRGEYVLTVAVPVFHGDTVAYALVAAVWPERVARLLGQQRLAADYIATVFDRTGTILARTNQMERLVGQKAPPQVLARMQETLEGSLERTSEEGVPVMTVFSRSTLSSWTLAFDIPMQSFTGELRRELGWLALCAGLLLCGSLAVAWLIGSRIAGAFQKLAAPALALGSGEAVIVPQLNLREADEVGQALTRASAMLMAAQHRANHDILTGLANRALFEEILNHQLAICGRTDRSLAVVYIDLDGFKPVNDAHGHAVGDDVLCLVAARLKEAIGESDLAARLGGDEFALILVNTALPAAQALARNVMQSLSEPYRVGAFRIEISASIGIASYPESGTAVEALSLRADEAMYKAKAAGKQRFAIAS